MANSLVISLLTWNDHFKALKTRRSTQNFAFSRLAALTWGCRVEKARQIYNSVIRSTLAYGASTFYTPKDKPSVLLSGLAREQSKNLRTILGAYQATPIRLLEKEANITPLDIYLRKRLEDFNHRLSLSPISRFI